ncbi:MAG: YihA family ribosome biogenesis GTP-binding protein [Gammaproteobacteria bacterium RIFCSPHIGHO2_12_FULL_45_12]|nr:MAG: YihA family ribosome biogenesis GTP-binding protein [Gammaproteobacteria bacterium RIFCSPHIGHO2_12_FULL_45_12]
MKNNYQKAHFLLSAADIVQLPPDQGIEIAFVGRSNAGKSSVLNRVTQNKGLARVSKTPGRTQLVNVFTLDDDRRLIDLPGYGYAKVPLAAKLKWQRTVDSYICERESLKGLILIMDCRHPLRELDVQLLSFCHQRGLPVHILLNKIDKISKSAAAATLRRVKEAVGASGQPLTLQLFSALNNMGIKELYALLDQWYGYA